MGSVYIEERLHCTLKSCHDGLAPLILSKAPFPYMHKAVAHALRSGFESATAV